MLVAPGTSRGQKLASATASAFAERLSRPDRLLSLLRRFCGKSPSNESDAHPTPLGSRTSRFVLDALAAAAMDQLICAPDYFEYVYGNELSPYMICAFEPLIRCAIAMPDTSARQVAILHRLMRPAAVPTERLHLVLGLRHRCMTLTEREMPPATTPFEEVLELLFSAFRSPDAANASLRPREALLLSRTCRRALVVHHRVAGAVLNATADAKSARRVNIDVAVGGSVVRIAPKIPADLVAAGVTVDGFVATILARSGGLCGMTVRPPPHERPERETAAQVAAKPRSVDLLSLLEPAARRVLICASPRLISRLPEALLYNPWHQPKPRLSRAARSRARLTA